MTSLCSDEASLSDYVSRLVKLVDAACGSLAGSVAPEGKLEELKGATTCEGLSLLFLSVMMAFFVVGFGVSFSCQKKNKHQPSFLLKHVFTMSTVSLTDSPLP